MSQRGRKATNKDTKAAAKTAKATEEPQPEPAPVLAPVQVQAPAPAKTSTLASNPQNETKSTQKQHQWIFIFEKWSNGAFPDLVECPGLFLFVVNPVLSVCFGETLKREDDKKKLTEAQMAEVRKKKFELGSSAPPIEELIQVIPDSQ